MSEPIEHDIKEEFDAANYIMLHRINDVLMFLLKNVNETDADMLAKLHEEGIFVTPPPAWKPGEE
jgi:hypothetical protein